MRFRSCRLLIQLLAAYTGLSVSVFAQYDLLVKGGHLIDPKNQINAVVDVAVADGKIAQVAANIPASQTKLVIDATGLYLAPGLSTFTLTCSTEPTPMPISATA